ncbi:Rieske 2Fe-2S domain-containing protein [Chromobacterium sp. IIBBL 290-4]|uniref:Rieske (2Fe-2S) protein n=1 Tax=Chromobacterium sp. IIBBL 290-4 TaxID=2953890 RepID=UPI0020B7AFCC|nr:Rieske 2Fe-2S domain-containing protein [Chromobacterium sp. IIBBL 290-4]UTH74067.1 Rieske 2Fe-2S domain-containing protein [Chromobacterium sp. IIBBL 290-4]
MAEPKTRLICASEALRNSGDAQRFTLELADGSRQAAFAVRYNGKVYAYLNRCCHIPVEMDLQDGRLFDLTGHYLICSMHGARYVPDSGYCSWGPCRGQSLTPLEIIEENGQVWLNVMSE